jgi:hypothetical protein
MLDDGQRGKAKLLVALVPHKLHVLRHPPNELALIVIFANHALKQALSASRLIARKSPQAKQVDSDEYEQGVIDDVHIAGQIVNGYAQIRDEGVQGEKLI